MNLQPASDELFHHGGPDDPRLGDLARQGQAALEAGGAARHAAALIGFADDRGVVNGGGRPGARQGPTEARRALYKLTPGAHGELERVQLADLGDAVPGDPERSVESVHAVAEQAVRQSVAAGAVVLFVGGGHDGSTASHSGLLESLGAGTRLAAVNVDAHLDVRPPREGRVTSGTPFRRLLERWGDRYALSELGIQPQHNARAHLAWAAARGATVHTLAAVRAVGAVEAFARALEEARAADAVAVSLDLDAVEAASAPGVSAPCPDGFSAAELFAFARLAGREPKVRLLDVMEFSPPLDENGRTARLAAACLWHFLTGLAERPG